MPSDPQLPIHSVQMHRDFHILFAINLIICSKLITFMILFAILLNALFLVNQQAKFRENMPNLLHVLTLFYWIFVSFW